MSLSERKSFKVVCNNIISLGWLQLFTYVVPLLTTPYLVKTLGADKFGSITLASVVIYYVGLISDYGFNISSTKEIALNRFDHNKVNIIYSETIQAKIVLLLISLIILVMSLNFIPYFKGSEVLYLYTFGQVIGQVLFPVWLFQGLEKMKIVTNINIFVRVSFLILIFFFVKNPSDYIYVPLLNSLGVIIGSIASLFIAHKYFGVKYKYAHFNNIKKRLLDTASFFYISIASSLMAYSPIVVLAIFTNESIVGYYSAIERIIKAIQSLYRPIFQAIYPYISIKLNDNYKRAVSFLIKMFFGLSILILITIFLMVFFSDDIILLLYNDDFLKYRSLFIYLSPWFAFGLLNNILGTQYLTAIGKENIYLKSFLIISLFTLLLSVFLTNMIGIYGPAVAISFGETFLFIMLIIQCYLYNKNKNLYA